MSYFAGLTKWFNRELHEGPNESSEQVQAPEHQSSAQSIEINWADVSFGASRVVFVTVDANIALFDKQIQVIP